MLQEVIWFIKPLLIPPGLLILLALWGVARSSRVSGRFLAVASLALLYLFSTPFVAGRLTQGLEQYAAIPPERLAEQGGQAIVVLGGGLYRGAPEFGGDTVSGPLLERVRYAAWIARRTGLPVIPSGGAPEGGPSEAEAVRRVLEGELGVRVAAVEGRSRTTWENARLIAPLLHELGVGRVFLVTHGWHMPRAVEVFQAAGIDVVPAPTGLAWVGDPKAADWLPDATALAQSYRVLHEYAGSAGYQARRWLEAQLRE